MPSYRDIILMHLLFRVRDSHQDLQPLPVSHLHAQLIVGYPIVNVPLGTLTENGRPFGLSFMGTVHPQCTFLIAEIFRANFNTVDGGV